MNYISVEILKWRQFYLLSQTDKFSSFLLKADNIREVASKHLCTIRESTVRSLFSRGFDCEKVIQWCGDDVGDAEDSNR